MTSLTYSERPAEGVAEGLLVLHHGRGADEQDLLPLADVLDPSRRLHVVCPRAPLTLPGMPGYHWYVVPRVGYPDPPTFRTACEALSALHDDLWKRSGLTPERTVLGGFSMGTVMSYALGLDPGRPAPAGILAFSGFVPTVEGWRPDIAGRGTRVLVAHGRGDPVIDVSFGRAAVALLRDAGADVVYHESGVGHTIDPAVIAPAGEWLAQTLGEGRSASGD